MMTAEGGMDIEELARTRPEALRRVHIDAMLGLRAFHVRELVGTLPQEAREGAADVLRRLYAMLQERDATLVEVNPLVVLEDGRVVALDAKVTVDDNALFRHEDIEAMKAAFPIDPVQARANDQDLQYVKLDGNVGIIGNGAGLVMSTLDVVAQAGARAANFLDVGGGASADQMATSLEVVLSDPAVKAVFINIFGGITRCDLVAQGVLGALERVEATVPIVVRLDGTNAEEGREILARGGPPADRRRVARCSKLPSEPPPSRTGRQHERPGRRRHETPRAGDHRARGDVPHAPEPLVRHAGRGGVTPGKAGQDVEGIPVFDTVADAVDETGANTAMIFVPPRFAGEAILESADAGVPLVVCITEGIPVKDMAYAHSYLRGRSTTLVGPNCPGVITPGVANVGIIPGEICAAGPGRSGESQRHARVSDRA